MAGIEWAVMLVGVLFYQFHKQLYDVCKKFGPFQNMPEPPSGIGHDDHQIQFVQTGGHVPDVEQPVQPSVAEPMDGTGDTRIPPDSAMATNSGRPEL